MAFQLTRKSDGKFHGAAGETVEVGIASGMPDSTVRIAYAGGQDGKAPFEFQIRQGNHKLLVVALGADDDQRMQVVEIEAGETRLLKRFFWSRSHFHTTLDIVGD